MSCELQQETRSEGRLFLRALYAASETRYTSERDKDGEPHSGRAVATTGPHIGSIMTEMGRILFLRAGIFIVAGQTRMNIICSIFDSASESEYLYEI